MPKATRRLRNLTIKEVSLVPHGDNPPARIVLYKARAPRLTTRERFTHLVGAVRKWIGDEPSEEVRKQLYDEVRSRQQGSTVLDALRQRMEALSESLQSIIWFPNDAEREQDTETLIAESVRQFADSIEADAAALLAGKIYKLRVLWPDAPPEPAEFTKALSDVLEDDAGDVADDSTAAGPENPQPKEQPMAKNLAEILAGLTEADRAIVKTTIDGQAAEIVKLTPKEPVDPLAALPADVRKQLETADAERAELKKQVDEMRIEREREAFGKTLVLKALPVQIDEVVELLFGLPVEKRGKVVAILKAADEAVLRGGLLDTLGTDRGAVAGSALQKIEERALELRKANPTISIEKARTQVLRENPDLYVLAENERAAALRGGALH